MEECKMLIDGKWVKSENTITSINPATEDAIGTVYCASKEQVEEAVNAAEKASHKWSELSLVLTREAAENLGRPEKVISPTSTHNLGTRQRALLLTRSGRAAVVGGT